MSEIRWYTLATDALQQQLETDPAAGLKSTDVKSRLAQYGYNQLAETKRRPSWRLFVDQFRDFMILVLLAAAIISGFIGDMVDTIAILVIVGLNAIIGAFQEYRAERAMAALKSMAAPMAHVIRDGQRSEIPATGLVVGDVVFLEAGDVVPADLRLFDNADLETNESMLTGESTGVSKQVEAIGDTDLPVAERNNMVFKGSQVNRGRATGFVVATGMATELGKIALLLQKAADTKTPLQHRMARFGKRLAIAILVICVVIFSVGLLRGEPVLLMLLTAISLAVAAIPEALPAVISVALAMGAWRMSQQNALLRNLPAVETLGSVSYICADKTGTLTENRMNVEHYYLAEGLLDALPDSAQRLGQCMALSNDVEQREDHLKGDPTETALYQAAQAYGYNKEELTQQLPRIAELPFDSDRKLMTTLHQSDSEVLLFTKGAAEQLVPLCPAADQAALLDQASVLADQGFRVLGLAGRSLPELPAEISPASMECDLEFLGLVALIDPPREEAAEAVQQCLNAGIIPVMITGDHPGTALAIAKRLGIADSEDQVLTGKDLTDLDAAQLQQQVKQVRVYARVNPAQKIDIVEALQGLGEFCAMTGDGVNDGPALKQADIGIAMGKKGTDVAREAADMVLLDDNFATIAAAVREGRHIFDNIRKFIKYTMTSNSGEIWVLFLAPFLGLPVPLLPIHILWINLVTDGLPGLALAAEPAEPGIMQRPPRPQNESIFAHGMAQHIVCIGLLIGTLSLLAMAWSYGTGDENWQTMVFSVLTFCQLAHVLAIRSETQSLWHLGWFSNLPLLGAVLLTVILQLCVIYIPMLNHIFNTQPLSLPQLGVCLVLPLIVVFAVEAEKKLSLFNRK